MADSILKVSGLRKSYRKKIILNNVSFEVHSGEIIGIVGANGCGKSTLLRMLAGADKPDTGLIEYGGQISSKNPAQFKKYIGYIPQENPLFENLSVIDNLRFHYCGCMESLPPVMERFGIRLPFGIPAVQFARDYGPLHSRHGRGSHMADDGAA